MKPVQKQASATPQHQGWVITQVPTEVLTEIVPVIIMPIGIKD
jgi:hypothetical protein